MPDQAMRARVERFLRGEAREDDLTRLFLFARDRCDGRECVKEIGDFVAHHHERTKGIVTRTAKDWAAIVRCQAWSIDGINPQHLPSAFPRALEATARRLDHATIKQQTGMSRAEIVARLPSIISKLHKHVDGTFAIYPFYTNKESAIINCLSSSIVASPAFTSERLFNDFAATLKSNALITTDELRTLSTLRHFIILYAAVIMHRTVIVIDDSFSIRLSTFGHQGGNVQVDCIVPIKMFNISTAIYSTKLDTADYCDPPLISIPSPWDFPLELTPQGRIKRLE